MFKPIERGSQMLAQLFDDQGQVRSLCSTTILENACAKTQDASDFLSVCLFFFSLLSLFLKAHYKPVWVEINGHAVNVFNGQRDQQPAVRFDLKETRMMASVRGQPR